MTTQELIKELNSTECRCGKKKNPRQTFCRACYFVLPRQMRLALYDRIGNGYEEAYDAAVKLLER